MLCCMASENAHILHVCSAFRKPCALPAGLILVFQQPADLYSASPGAGGNLGERSNWAFIRPEMALFPLSGVLRGIAGCDVLPVRLAGIPCAALLSKKITHFWIGHYR